MEKSLTDIEVLLHAMQAQSQCCAFCIQMHVPLLFVRTDARTDVGTRDLVDIARGLWLISAWKTSLSILKANLEWTLNLQSNGQSNRIHVNFPPIVVFLFSQPRNKKFAMVYTSMLQQNGIQVPNLRV